MLGLLLALLLYSAPEGAAAADGADAITFVLEEVPRSGGSSPRMRFSFQTVGILSCHRLQAAFRKSGDVLRLGPISRESFSPCPPTVVPAAGSREVDLEPGRYELHVLNNGADDLFEVEISDFLIRTRALRPPAASAVGDPVVLRVLENSFALGCGGLKETGPAFCAEALQAVRSSPGISELPVPEGARTWFVQRNAYWHNEPTHFFRYGSEADLTQMKSRLLELFRKITGDKRGYEIVVGSWKGTDAYLSTE